MTEKEYFLQIEQIRRYTRKGKLDDAASLLDRMYAYKPTRLLWFVAKAEYVLAQTGDFESALKILDDKYTLLEDYPGLKECIQFRVKTLKAWGKERDAEREAYCYRRACGEACAQEENVLQEALEAFASNVDDAQALHDLREAFYRTSDVTASLLAQQAQIHFGYDACGDWTKSTDNFGYIQEKLLAKEKSTFILIADEYQRAELDAIGHLLYMCGQKVYVLDMPVVVDTEEKIQLRETVGISLDNIQAFEDMTVIPTVACALSGAIYGDNREYIIDHICRNESVDDSAVLLCSGYMMDELFSHKDSKRRMGRLSPYEADYLEEKLHFGWAGSYLSYISVIYGYDVRRDIEALPEVDFSILIPARNAAHTLRHTLATCLNQKYTGSYEIVVSDNSVDEDTGIFDLCAELNDPRIRYVKTPRSLHLAKSFEFGFLQTRGEFVLAIGADDGLLPWGLEDIKKALDRFQQADIILWERGFYAWPGFNGGQENMFAIPRKYPKALAAQWINAKSMLKDISAQNAQLIYLLPLLYINSGFRRRYLKRLLETTGKLWNGVNQDVTTGVINCCINQSILQLNHPISIAGMSSGSVGYLDNQINTQHGKAECAKSIKRLLEIDNIGKYVYNNSQKYLFSAGIDVTSLRLALTYAMDEGLLEVAEGEQFLSWQQSVEGVINKFSLLKDSYDFFIHVTKYMSKKLGKDKARWYEQTVYSKVFSPLHVNMETIEQGRRKKTYEEKKNQLGGEVMDASRFGVSNIADAVNLFAERTGLL